MMARLPALGWLLLVWVALWEDASPATLASGAAVGTTLLVLFPLGGERRPPRVRPVAAARFAGYFLWKLLEANLVVAWEVITPSNAGVTEGIVRVPVTGASDAVVTLVANALSLTPGTLTIEVERNPTALYVHVLHLRSVERTRRDVMRLEELALAAFGSVESIRGARRHRAELDESGEPAA